MITDYDKIAAALLLRFLQIHTEKKLTPDDLARKHLYGVKMHLE